MGSSDTLRSVIDAGRSSKRLDELSAARVVGKIALQIHAAQQKAGAGKAVGPISPAHIKLAPNGEAKLDITEGGALGYSSPEQTMGGFGDRRSDVFSLGTVLWEALTHQRLFEAMNDAAVRMAVQEREIQAPSEINANVPAELSAICMRALARNPTDRYQSLKAMAVELEEFLEEAGYGDDDSKIAAYLTAMKEPPKQVKIEMAPLARPASSTPPPPSAPEKTPNGTQPPSNVLKQPATPSMLGEPPKDPRPKSPSGAALAAALANAGAPPATNGSHAGLPQASPATTAVGVPKLSDWQDSASTAHAHTSPPPAAAPVVPVDASPSSSAAAPLPPVLPSGSTAMRTDKATIAAAVPPQVKVATVEAKHVEAKQPAVIVEDKPKAKVVEDKPKAKIVEDKLGKIVDDGKATLVDSKPPAIEVPKLVDGKLPETKPAPLPSAVATVPVAAVAPAEAAKPAADAVKPAAEAPKPERAGSHSEAKTPHPVAAVSLGPIPGGTRDSKDVLAGWGWGTDKHNAIAPEDYPHDDEYDYHHGAHDPKKTLMYVIGGGLALAALVTIIAVGFGGSSSKKKSSSAAKQAETAPAVAETPPPPPAPPPVAPEAAGSAAGSADQAAGSASAQVAADPAATEAAKAEAAKAEAAAAEAAKAAAAKQEADRIAAEQEQAKQAEAAKAEAARIAAEKEDAKKQAAAKKAEDAKLAAEQKKAEAARIAAEKEAKKQEAARVAAEKATARKAEADRLAAERAKKAEAAKTAKTPPKTRPESARKVETKVAKAEPARAEKADAEASYRQGLQQFARGDTSGALASLRNALAANPSYAPTWRGLGLVFEKMGEKDQARAAFKRYLQLAPGAADSDQIRARLERLGS